MEKEKFLFSYLVKFLFREEENDDEKASSELKSKIEEAFTDRVVEVSKITIESREKNNVKGKNNYVIYKITLDLILEPKAYFGIDTELDMFNEASILVNEIFNYLSEDVLRCNMEMCCKLL